MLNGTLDDFALPDVLRLLASGKKTGRLELARPAGTGYFAFTAGAVAYAETDLSASLLGQKLVRMGAITEPQLRRALDRRSETGSRLGRVLLQEGLVTEAALADALRSQVEEAAFELLSWDVGEFSWRPGDPPRMDADVSLSVEALLLDSARRREELDALRREIAAPGAVLKLAERPPEGASEISISPAEWRILVLVDGMRSVADVARTAGVGELEAMRGLYGLAIAGLVEVARRSGADEPAGWTGRGGLAGGPGRTPPGDRATRAPRPSPAAGEATDDWFEDPEAPIDSLIAARSAIAARPTPGGPNDTAAAHDPASGEKKGGETSINGQVPQDVPGVDRAAAVRELSGLADEARAGRHPAPDEAGPTPEPSGPKGRRGRRRRRES